MKLDEAKALICQQGVTDETMAEFLTSLRRVPGAFLKCQHCYLLAYQIREQDYEGALRLIRYGLKHFAEDTMTRRFCYEKLAEVHRAHQAWEEAHVCFAAARELMAQERGDMAHIGAFYVLMNELDRTGYAWSAELERCYEQIDMEDSVFLGLRDNAFTLAIAEYLISERRGDAAFMAHAREKMQRLLYDDTPTEVDRIYQRHRVDTRVALGEGEAEFLWRIGLLSETT